MSSKYFRLGAVLLFNCALAASIQAQPQPKPTPTADAFASLLERARKADPTVDFQQLRMAFTDTAEYSPYASDRDSRQKMFAAMKTKDYGAVLEFAKKILADNFLDLNGQFGAFVAHRELGHATDAATHKFLFEGMIHSIEKSGDGKTAATAFVVISTDEEYVLLNWRGLRPTAQALVHQNGHSYDRMTALDPKTNERVEYYFNIDKPFGWLGKSLKQ